MQQIEKKVVSEFLLELFPVFSSIAHLPLSKKKVLVNCLSKLLFFSLFAPEFVHFISHFDAFQTDTLTHVPLFWTLYFASSCSKDVAKT